MENPQGQTKRRMTRKAGWSLAVLCAISLAVTAAACCAIFIKPAKAVQQYTYSEQAVQQGTLKNGVTESGTVAFGITSQLYDLDVSTDSDEDEDDEEEDGSYLKVEEVYVAVGQRVQEGDLVYRFTQSSIDSVRKALAYEKTEAQIALATAQSSYELGVLEAELSRNETLLDTSLAQTTYNTAIARLSNDMAAKSLEIEQLLKDIYKLQCDLTQEDYLEERSDIRTAYEDALKSVEDAGEDYVTRKVDAAQAFQSAKASYEQFFSQFDASNQQIQDKISQVYEIEQQITSDQQLLEKELLAAQQDLQMSAVSGEIADVKYQASLTGYENALAKAQRELEEAAEKLEAFDAFVGDGTVCAAGSGIVTEIGYAAGDFLKNTGTLIAFAKAEDMTVSVDVSQEDVAAIKVGDAVELNFSAYEGERYHGAIQSITTTATSRNTATVSYPVVVSIQGDTSRLYSGMTADVTFVTEEAQDVSYVLRKAIVEENGKSQLYVRDGEAYVLTPVTTGFNNGEYIEIRDGINAGDRYYIRTLVREGGADEK
ncbi:MAG: efflux RND transporter periplasmic adaptor subunit [Lachnospiraceae bacterium]|nr:efflux RND transporter periplasmic adaptor subunit [Lachnospiraceae bacterium]